MAKTQVTAKQWSTSELIEIGYYLRFANSMILIWFCLVAVILLTVPFAFRYRDTWNHLSSIIELSWLIIWVIQGVLYNYGLYKLAQSLKRAAPILYAFTMMLQIFGLIIVWLLVREATNQLRANGIKVGVMGANKEDLEHLRLQTSEAD